MSYDQLAAHQRQLSSLSHALSMLEWDQAAMMPKGGAAARAEALGTLEELRHELANRPEVSDWIAAAKAETLGPWEAANLREIEREHRRATALPGDLVGARARARSAANTIWEAARPANDWEAFRPALEEIFRLETEAAEHLADALECSPYDALIDIYEPGGRIEAIDALFGELEAFLMPFIPEAIEDSRARPPVELEGPFDPEAQRRLGLELMTAAGFDFDRGRLDRSAHPFCGGVPDDVRITTRYDPADFGSGLMGVLHETGHAKYEQGLPQKWSDQPVGRARSMSFHESQSLLQEMQISRSRPFLSFARDAILRAFPERASTRPEAFTLENLVRINTRVQASKIRVDADEVTYPAHVILRTRIERDLVAGRMKVADIPERWDALMHELLGVDTRGDFRDGCMQDVHWAFGAIGYFPTYTLGAMRAAQIFAALRKDLPECDAHIERGDFEAIDTWLRERIWSRGSQLEGEALMMEATGRPLEAGPFIAHLRTRYGTR